MPLYSLNKPSTNMNISISEMNRMLAERRQEEFNRNGVEQINESTELSYDEYIKDYVNEAHKSSVNRSTYLSNVKNSLLAECLYKIYSESSVSPITSGDKVIIRNSINKFITEHGANKLLLDFRTKNMLLSEVNRIVTKYYDKVLEAYDCCEEVEFTLDDNITNDFYKELECLQTDDACKLIKDRVSDAIAEFIDDNVTNKIEYEEVIKAAQDKIATTTEESFIEQYNNQAKLKINEMKLARRKNIFHCVVESLSTAILKDDNLKSKYMVNEATLDMDKIVESAQIIYTMLEMVNTTEMVNVDEQYMNNYIKSLV